MHHTTCRTSLPVLVTPQEVNMKSRFVLLAVTAFLMATSVLAGSGIEGGNGELFRPRNTKGKLIELQLSSKHPQHDELIDMVTKAELPGRLKNEILSDLASTAILYTNEIVTYGDTQRQLQLLLTKVISTEKKDAAGNVTQTTTKEYALSEVASKLGIYITPANIIARNLDKTLVAAYTEAETGRVVYFSSLVKKMTPDEALTLVLHEQAHRLQYLRDFRDNDRFIEAWATALAQYLQGKMPQVEFFNILKQNRLSVDVDNLGELPGEILDPACACFRATVDVKVRAEDLVYAGVGEDKMAAAYILQVKRSTFAAYPQLQRLTDLVDIVIDEVKLSQLYTIIDQKIHDGIRTQEGLPLSITFSYKKDVMKDWKGFRYAVLKFEPLATFNPTKRMKLFEQTVKTLLGNHANFVFVDSLASSWGNSVFLDENYLIQLESVFSRLREALDQISQNDSVLFALIKKRMVQTTLTPTTDKTAATFEVVYVPGNVPKLDTGNRKLLLSLNPFESPEVLTVEVFKSAFKFADTDTKPAYQEYALRQLRAALSKFRVDVEFDTSTDPSTLEKFNNFVVTTPALLSKLRCIYAQMNTSLESAGQADQPRVVTIRFTDTNPIWWELNRTAMKFNVPLDLLNSNPQELARFLTDTVFTPNGYYKAVDSITIGRGVWDHRTNKLRTESRSHTAVSDYLFKAIQTCAPGVPVRRGN